MDSIDVWKGRKYLYGLIGTVFARPIYEKWLRELTTQGFSDFIQSLEFSPTVAGYYKDLLDGIEISEMERKNWIKEMQLEYDRLFTVPVKGQFVSLGSSLYLPKESDLNQRRAFLEELYKRFGFIWKDFMRDTSGVWPSESEHIVLVLPMMAILAEEIINSLNEQDEFLETLLSLFQQVLRMTRDWIPACMKAVEKATNYSYFKFFARILIESLENEYTLMSCPK